MINKIIVDGENVELTDSSQVPFRHTFSQAKEHEVKYGLDSTTEICAYAFKDCKNLTYISIPDVITEIKRGAFQNCENLPTIHISENVNYIGKEAFDGCKKLTDIIFDGNEHRLPPNTYCNIPEQTTCFIPNDSKYVPVNFADIDLSGDIDYYTVTPWNQYEHVDDLSMIDSNIQYYRNQWDQIAPNYKIKENKDRHPVERIAFDATTYSSTVGSTETISYIIYPENCTNLNLYWTYTGEPGQYFDIIPTGVAGEIDVKMKSKSTGGAILTAYAESGIRASVRFYIN